MVNTIMEAIGIALNAEFGSNYEIHTEEMEQDLKRPCFLISCINHTSKLFLGKRYLKENTFCIRYFPEQEGQGKRECNEVAERLFLCLEWLGMDGELVKGTRMKHEDVGGILNFFVNYDMYVQKRESLPTMERLEGNVSAKGRWEDTNERWANGKTQRNKNEKNG